MPNELNSKNTRVILFHKHPMSANLHFVCFPHGGVTAFEGLPALSVVDEQEPLIDEFNIAVHPSVVSTWVERELDLQSGTLATEVEYCESVEVPGGHIRVYLLGFMQFSVLQKAQLRHGLKLRGLLDCIGLAPVEMQLLKKAYRVIMG